MNTKNYWQDIDKKLELLVDNGYVKLPSLKLYDLDKIAHNISSEMGSLTFKELGFSHKKFLDELEVEKYLTPKLFFLFSYWGAFQSFPHSLNLTPKPPRLTAYL